MSVETRTVQTGHVWMRGARVAALGVILSLFAPTLASTDAAPSTQVDCLDTDEALAYWRPIREQVSENESPADELALQLVDCLGSPHPELRDRIGYEVLTYWLRGEHVSNETRRALLTTLSANVRNGADDAALLRSFSALVLAELLRSDANDAFMTDAERAVVLSDVTTALEKETDFRGLVHDLGWVHPVAHMSDVLWRLGLHPATTGTDAEAILAALGPKIAPTATSYAFNESDRMARVVVILIRRSLLAPEVVVEWLAGFESPRTLETWGAAFQSPEGMAELHNTKLFLRALSDQLAGVEVDPSVAEKLDQLVRGFTGLV